MGTNHEQDLFWVNQLIELHHSSGVFSSQIIKVEEDKLQIQQPIDKESRFMKIRRNMPVTIYFFHDQKGLAKFESEIIGYPEQIAIKRPAANDIEKVYRRNFFRVPAKLRVYLERNPEAKLEPALVFTENISGGGFAFLYPEALEQGLLLSGKLHLLTEQFEEYVDFKAQVVDTRPKNNKTFLNAVQFVDMSEQTRTKIIKYCIQKQVELRNKVKDYYS